MLLCRLPLYRFECTDDARHKSAPVAHVRLSQCFPRPLILIVDDTPANISVLVDLLSAHNFAVSVAEDGESALEQVAYVQPDLILLDVLMPKVDGFATCSRLKQQPLTSEIPVIFMTGLIDTVSKVKGFELGAVDYITKPFQHDEVLARINLHLALRQLNTRLQQSEERLSRIIESIMDAIVTLDRDGRIRMFNRAAERMFRCSAKLAIGQSCERFLSAPLHRIVIEGAERAAACAMWIPDGHDAVRADGDTFPVEASLSCARAGDQTIHTLILRDISERNKARLREMGARIQHDIEEERKRISQSLHDEMGQNLTALQLDADWMRRHCEGNPCWCRRWIACERASRRAPPPCAGSSRICARACWTIWASVRVKAW